MSASPLAPGSTIGILGGGQLGRMLAMAAARLGYRTVIFDPDPNAPAAQVANAHFGNAWDDGDALAAFAEACDVVTYEFENVPVETVERLERSEPVRPGAKALRTAQDRLLEKALALFRAGADRALRDPATRWPGHPRPLLHCQKNLAHAAWVTCIPLGVVT